MESSSGNILSDNERRREDEMLKQVEDMKHQTANMKQFRVALGSALDQVKCLRSELAQEKSKGYEALHKFRLSVPPDQQDDGSASGGFFDRTLDKSHTGRQPFVTSSGVTNCDDVSRIIRESEGRLDRVRDAISERSDLIRDLRKRLQHSSSILLRRESKLEEKINHQNDLKTQIENLSLEKNDLKSKLEKCEKTLMEEREVIYVKDKEIVHLAQRLSDMEEQLYVLHQKMSVKNRELSEVRSRLVNPPMCGECLWMRQHIRRLEMQLHNLMSSGISSYRSTLATDYQASLAQQWYGTNHGYVINSPTTPVSSPPRPQHRAVKQLRTEAIRRNHTTNRQRAQEFRNASLVLSPIREDTEEPSSSHPILSKEVVDPSPRNNKNDSEAEVTLKSACDNSNDHSPATPGEVEGRSKPEKVDVAYFHIASRSSHPGGDATSETTTEDHFTSSPKLNSSLHSTSTASPKQKPVLPQFLSPIRPSSYINSSATSCGSAASTESPTSDTAGCSSDSAVASQSKKRVKHRRVKRRPPSNTITFRHHCIDITRFTSEDFRQIMWSLSTEPGAVDQFLTFLANHAERLQNDPQWLGNHSLGTPGDWLALKGSY